MGMLATVVDIDISTFDDNAPNFELLRDLDDSL
jgi:hypothetical protein